MFTSCQVRSFLAAAVMVATFGVCSQASALERATASADGGIRISIVKHVFLTANVRPLFDRQIRPTKGEGQNSAVAYLQHGGITIIGRFDPEQNSEIGALLFGGGFRF